MSEHYHINTVLSGIFLQVLGAPVHIESMSMAGHDRIIPHHKCICCRKIISIVAVSRHDMHRTIYHRPNVIFVILHVSTMNQHVNLAHLADQALDIAPVAVRITHYKNSHPFIPFRSGSAYSENPVLSLVHDLQISLHFHAVFPAFTATFLSAVTFLSAATLPPAAAVWIL